MKFIRKKNMQESEELLYVPGLHWMYTTRPMVLSLPYFLVLLICWCYVKNYAGSCCLLGNFSEPLLYSVIKNLFLAGIIIVLLVFVWRIFQYLTTEYGVTNKRLIIKKGICRITITEIPFDRIETITCVQGILGRIFKYGTVFISGIGGTLPVFFMVSKPFALRRKIADIIEKNKTITVVHGNPPKPKPSPKPGPKVEEEPVFRYGTFVRVLPDNRS